MRVRCLYSYPWDDFISRLGSNFHGSRSCPATEDKEYLVLAMALMVEFHSFGTGTFVQILGDQGVINLAPLSMFEITDARVSRYWEAVSFDGKSVTLEASSFEQTFYYDSSCEKMLGFEENFNLLYAQLDVEFSVVESTAEIFLFSDKRGALPYVARIARQMGYRVEGSSGAEQASLSIFYQSGDFWFWQDMEQTNRLAEFSPDAWTTIAENGYRSAFSVSFKPSSLPELKLLLQHLLAHDDGWVGGATQNMQPIFKRGNIEDLFYPYLTTR